MFFLSFPSRSIASASISRSHGSVSKTVEPGARIPVSCNGVALLTNFDILSDAGPSPTIKTFDNVQATAEGKIELSFTPVLNYALINAIEVLPEPAP
jgi:hypothetical protein